MLFLGAIVQTISYADVADPVAANDGWLDLQKELQSAAPQVASYEIQDAVPLAWERKKHPERKLWSEYAESVVNQYFSELNQAEDIPEFCKDYESLSREQKVQALADVFASISYWEAGWDPLDRTAGPGLDDLTHEKSMSEGLLQLSYSDMDSYRDLQTNQSYCPFDWEKDKTLSTQDVHRSILNPYVNLYCGIRIMADSVVTNVIQGKRKLIYNEYWDTMGPFQMKNFFPNRANEIKGMVQKLPFCGGRHWVTPQGLFLKTWNMTQKAIKHAGEPEQHVEESNE